ncbi:hypothetical protein ACFY7Z_25015 [Streptomyces sp. NPDC012623]|uniref:hypothetical protein n=1 Tax=unclassified Streptomyces TaxID=2593676 RepID=UPI003677FC50
MPTSWNRRLITIPAAVAVLAGTAASAATASAGTETTARTSASCPVGQVGPDHGVRCDTPPGNTSTTPRRAESDAPDPAKTDWTGRGAPRAAAACQTREGSEHVDWTGMWFDHDVVCDNSTGDVRLQSFVNSPVVGRINSTRSWFVCWKTGDGASESNNFWYYTQGDEVVSRPSTAAWGYLPASMLKSDSHPVPGLPKCSWA